MDDNTTCSNKKCPLSYKFSANNRNCNNCIYKTKHNTSQTFSSNRSNMNSFKKQNKNQQLEFDNNFKKVTKDISNYTFNYKEEISDPEQTIYNTQNHFQDFYKVEKNSLSKKSKIIILLSIIIMVCTILFIKFFVGN
ncbi:MAG: hypothetical protein ABF289_01005 [Clostridiales bacterium]